jgi:hypothetical protein
MLQDAVCRFFGNTTFRDRYRNIQRPLTLPNVLRQPTLFNFLQQRQKANKVGCAARRPRVREAHESSLLLLLLLLLLLVLLLYLTPRPRCKARPSDSPRNPLTHSITSYNISGAWHIGDYAMRRGVQIFWEHYFPQSLTQPPTSSYSS